MINGCPKGNALLELGRHPEAVTAFDQAILLNPKHAIAHNNKGFVTLSAWVVFRSSGDGESQRPLGSWFIEWHLEFINTLWGDYPPLRLSTNQTTFSRACLHLIFPLSD
jgi:hypothetical protein